MESHDKEYLKEVLAEAANRAARGELADADRVALYRFALSAAANEFYRIEKTAAGSVDPNALLLIQQISLLCEDNVDLEKLAGSAGVLDGTDEENPNGSKLVIV